jgi:uncharacterized protein YbaA (DUF1428 family)
MESSMLVLHLDVSGPCGIADVGERQLVMAVRVDICLGQFDCHLRLRPQRNDEAVFSWMHWRDTLVRDVAFRQTPQLRRR